MRDDAKRAPLLGVMCCILCKIFRFFLKLTAWPRKIWDTFAKNATLRNEKEEVVVSKATLVDDLT